MATLAFDGSTEKFCDQLTSRKPDNFIYVSTGKKYFRETFYALNQ